MKTNSIKKSYQQPKVEQVQLDTEISLVMTSPPNDPWSSSPQNPNNAPGGFIQKVFKIV
ncbi:MAG: hypothetical protein RLZZ211_130 [Bacteroidota bacterium]|jgi:hypothetical protein